MLIRSLLERADADGMVWTPALSKALDLEWSELDGVTPPAERMFPMVTAPGATAGRGAAGGPRRAPGASRRSMPR